MKEFSLLIMLSIYDFLLNIFEKIGNFIFSHSINLKIDLETYLSIFIALLFGSFFHFWLDDVSTIKTRSSNRAIIDHRKFKKFLSNKEKAFVILWHRTVENLFGVFLVIFCILFNLYLLFVEHNEYKIYCNSITIFKIYSSVVIIYLMYIFLKTYVLKALDVRHDEGNYFYLHDLDNNDPEK